MEDTGTVDGSADTLVTQNMFKQMKQVRKYTDNKAMMHTLEAKEKAMTEDEREELA